MNNEEEDDPLDQEIDFSKLKVDWERTNKLRARAREAIEKGEKPTRIIIEMEKAMSEQQTTEEKLLGRLRETSLRERIEIAQAMIGHMCKDGRPPKMSIPVQYADEDFYITITLGDAAARIKELEALRDLAG